MKLSPLQTCVSCGQRALQGHALCKRCLGRRKLQADLARPFPSIAMNRGETRQAEEARSFGSSVIVRICPHHLKDWTECPTCTDAADFDDGFDLELPAS